MTKQKIFCKTNIFSRKRFFVKEILRKKQMKNKSLLVKKWSIPK